MARTSAPPTHTRYASPRTPVTFFCMTSVRCNDDVIITTIYYAAAYTRAHSCRACVFFCLISHVFLFYNSWPCSYTPSRAFTFHRHVSSRSTDTCLHTLHALRCSRTFIFICCRCSFKLQARARVTSPVNSYALLCFWFTCWWITCYALFCIDLAGIRRFSAKSNRQERQEHIGECTAREPSGPS